jgi:4-amino-4-deoxy-L-arabinose transferase-like glycosyltransferase
MRARHAWLLGAAACAYLLLHVATLTRSPVPYFDDTYFASIGETFARTGELRLDVSPLLAEGPVYLYGPVYFLAQGAMFRALGVGIFQNRVLGLVFGIGVVVVVFASLCQAGIRGPVARWICVLLALDPTLNLSLHSGRMDNVALFFILASFLLLQHSWASAAEPRLSWCAAAGLLAALGILTTPRPGYLVVLLGMILLLRWGLARPWPRALPLVAWGLPLAGLYSVWVWYAFGSVRELVAYYGQFADTYVGGRFAVRPIHVPLLAILAAVGALRLRTGRRLRGDELLGFTLVGIAAFYALGINSPRFGTVYAVFTIPLVYMALARLLVDLPDARVWGVRGEQVRRLVCATLLIFNTAAFAARVALEVGQWGSRDPAPADQAVRTLLPPGAKVIGDDKFYFAVVRAGGDFQYWQRGGTVAARVAYHADDYRFDYLITNEDETSDLFRAYATGVPLVAVATLAGGERGTVAEWVSGVARTIGVGAPLAAGYEGVVFARADRRPEQR